MIKIADCRYLANQCRMLAGKAEINEMRRKALLEMAATWDGFAQELVKDQWRGRRILGVAPASSAMRRLEDVTR